MEEKLITSLDGNTKKIGGDGKIKIRPAEVDPKTTRQSKYTKESWLESYSKLNSKIIFVDKKLAEINGIEEGYYYKVDDIVEWLWEISQGKNLKNDTNKTIFYINRKEIETKKDLSKIIKPSFEISKISTIKQGKYINKKDIPKILNNIKGLPELLTSSDYIKGFEASIPNNSGDIKVTIKVNTNKEKKATTNNHDKIPTDTNSLEKKAENSDYTSQSLNSSPPTQNYNANNDNLRKIQQAIGVYVGKDDETGKEESNPKRRKPTKEELKKIAKILLATIGAVMLITVGKNIVTGLKEQAKPQPLPKPTSTPTSTIDLSSVAENPNGEEIIKTEITNEDLYEYIDLGASYYISDNANLYRRGIDTTRAGVTTAGEAKVTSIIICESKKDIEGNTVLENKQTISLNDGKLSETNLGKIYNQWLKNVEGNNFVIKVHLSRKNEVTNQEEGYGWVEVNKETFNDLYESLQNSNKITYQ